MHFRGIHLLLPAAALLGALAGPAVASELKMEIRSAVQSERGGTSLLDDRSAAARSAVQVTPSLMWRWEGHRTTLDAMFAPSMDVPERGAGFLAGLRGHAGASFYPHARVMLQGRFDAGRVSFDERSLWSGRNRMRGEARARVALQPSLHLNGAYRYSHSVYGEREDVMNALPGRDDGRHALMAGLTWFSRHFWLYGEVETEQNASSQTAYSYEGRDLNSGAGLQAGRLRLSLHASRSVRHYDREAGDVSTWRTLWLSGDASWAVSSWFSLFGGLQHERGTQDGETAFDPWTLAHGGFRLTLPLKSRRPMFRAAGKRLGPIRTEEGWVFRFEAEDAETVHLVGTFSGWDPQEYELRQVPGTSIWEIVIPLEPGIYEYAYVVDGGRWEAPQRAPIYVSDGFGSRNGVLVVEDEDRRR